MVLAERLVFVLQNPEWTKLTGQFAVQHVHDSFSLSIAMYTLKDLYQMVAKEQGAV